MAGNDTQADGWFARISLWRSKRRNAAVLTYAQDYYRVLKSEFESLDPEQVSTNPGALSAYSALVSATDALLESEPQKLTIQQVFQVEMALIRILPDENLRAKVWSARSAYRKVVGESMYQQYIASSPPDPRKAKTDAVRADVADLVKGTHWWYVNALVMERGLKSFKVILFTWMWAGFLVLVIIMSLLIGSHAMLAVGEEHRLYFRVLNVTFLTIYAGMLGAIISTARRIKLYVRVPMNDTDPVIRLTGMENGQTGLKLSIMSGGVFALFLYFLFVAGLGSAILSGNLIPTFSNPQDLTLDACCLKRQLSETFYGMIPKDSASVAKLIIWSFIAGFGEKFVPDILDRLSASGSADRRAGGSPIATASGTNPPSGGIPRDHASKSQRRQNRTDERSRGPNEPA